MGEAKGGRPRGGAWPLTPAERAARAYRKARKCACDLRAYPHEHSSTYCRLDTPLREREREAYTREIEEAVIAERERVLRLLDAALLRSEWHTDTCGDSCTCVIAEMFRAAIAEGRDSL